MSAKSHTGDGPVILTGARGRISSELADRFALAGRDVVRVSRTGGGGHTLYGDFFPAGLLPPGSTLLHCAWSSVPATAEKNPQGAWTDDLPLLASLLTKIAALPPQSRPHFVFFSSGGAIYGECRRPAVEDDPPAPIGWYGAGKAAAERLIESFGKLAGIQAAILRISNPYGFPHTPEKPQGIVGAALHAIQTGHPLGLLGDGDARKDFLHIDDLWSAVSDCADARLVGTYNVCSGQSAPAKEIIRLIECAAGRAVPRESRPPAPWDVKSCLLSNQKFRTATGWQPGVPLEEGIRKVVASALAG